MFNAEKFLNRCLMSVFGALEKFGENAEVLIIDNGSTDRSREMVKEIKAPKNVTVKELKCATKGASAVRNFGAEKAQGRYIWFVDADDEIEKNSISLLIEKAEKSEADLVMMGAKRVYEDGHEDYLSAVKAGSPDYKSRFVRYGAGPWQFLIRREWWLSNDFVFREGMIHEDMELISSLILYTNKFASVDKPLYIYCQNGESVLHKSKWDGHAFDIFSALSGLYERFEKAGAAEEFHDELEWFFIWNLLIDSAKDFARFPEGKSGFKKSREMLRKYFPNWRKNRFLKEKPLKLRLYVLKSYFTF